MIHENCLILLHLTHVLDFRERGLPLYLSLSIAALPVEEISLSNCQESPIFDAQQSIYKCRSDKHIATRNVSWRTSIVIGANNVTQISRYDGFCNLARSMRANAVEALPARRLIIFGAEIYRVSVVNICSRQINVPFKRLCSYR